MTGSSRNGLNSYPAYNNSDTSYPSARQSNTATLFTFDPNTLDENGFRKLGLPEKTVHTLINYRNKGGHFYKPEDLSKIYGLSDADAQRLIPYVKIAGTKKDKESYQPAQPEYAAKKVVSDDFKLDINKATAEDWKKFPGIGDGIANRIVKFRYSKGGFTSVDDVAKTYGISDSLFQTIKPHLVYEK